MSDHQDSDNRCKRMAHMGDDIAKRLLAVRAFLAGQNALGGMRFGEDHPTIEGPFWWRQVHLPVLHEAAAELTRLRARCDAADKLAMTAQRLFDDSYVLVEDMAAALSAYEEAAK